MENKNTLINNLVSIFNKLTLKHKIILGSAFGFIILMFITVMFVFNEPSYTTLYTNLAPEDASKIVEDLSAQKVSYRLEDNGTTIKVPKEKVNELRIAFASKGVPTSGYIGYEIFDKSTMGLTEFMQQLNFRRALEGEIARTISQIENVENARVHIVIPKKAIFRDEEKPTTASVILKLKGNTVLSENKIMAISNLVASSVEGLTPDNVTILDTKGKLLSKSDKENAATSVSSKNYEIKQSVENYLSSKAQSILDNVIGVGNSFVQVTVDLNFDLVEKTMEIYDPESQVAISQQSIRSDIGSKKQGDTTSQVNENLTTNYEVSKTIQRVVEQTGNIKRLSVAAVINGTYREVKNGDKVENVYTPRTPEQMLKLEEIIKKAVGFDELRADQVSIENIPFETISTDKEETASVSPLDEVGGVKNLILVVIGLVAALITLKALMSKLKTEKIIIGGVPGGYIEGGDFYEGSKQIPQLESGTPATAGSLTSGTRLNLPERKKNLLPVGNIEDEITDEAISKKLQHEKIVNYVAKNPAEAAKLINTWLLEDEDAK